MVSECDLRGKRIIAAINGLELFGHERGNIEVFRTLRGLGADVLVGVNAIEDNRVADYLTENGFQTFPLPFGSQWSKKWALHEPSIILRQPYRVLQCSRIFKRNIEFFNPTHVHLGSDLAYSYVSLALATCKIPLVYRMGDCPPVDSPFNLRIWKALIRRSTRIVANSDYVRSSAISTVDAAEKFAVIYNHPARRTAAESNSCESWMAGEADDRLLYVGAVSEEKGLFPLVDAFAELLAEHPQLQLDIAGGSRWDGEFRARLLDIVAARGLTKKVNMLGFVDNVAPAYRHAKLHVAPSIWEEPSGNSVVEAKQQGTPSVIFPSGGLIEHVRHKVDGFVCSEKSAGALAEALRWMLADPARLRRMGEAAREDYESRFGLERFQRAWAKVYLSA